jgi:hypothetical protein
MSLHNALVRLELIKHLKLDLRKHYCSCRRCRKVLP